MKVGSVAELEEAEHPSGICHEWLESGWNLDGKWLENGLIKWKIDGTWLRQPCLQLFSAEIFVVAMQALKTAMEGQMQRKETTLVEVLLNQEWSGQSIRVVILSSLKRDTKK